MKSNSWVKVSQRAIVVSKLDASEPLILDITQQSAL